MYIRTSTYGGLGAMTPPRRRRGLGDGFDYNAGVPPVRTNPNPPGQVYWSDTSQMDPKVRQWYIDNFTKTPQGYMIRGATQIITVNPNVRASDGAIRYWKNYQGRPIPFDPTHPNDYGSSMDLYARIPQQIQPDGSSTPYANDPDYGFAAGQEIEVQDNLQVDCWVDQAGNPIAGSQGAAYTGGFQKGGYRCSTNLPGGNPDFTIPIWYDAGTDTKYIGQWPVPYKTLTGQVVYKISDVSAGAGVSENLCGPSGQSATTIASVGGQFASWSGAQGGESQQAIAGALQLFAAPCQARVQSGNTNVSDLVDQALKYIATQKYSGTPNNAQYTSAQAQMWQKYTSLLGGNLPQASAAPPPPQQTYPAPIPYIAPIVTQSPPPAQTIPAPQPSTDPVVNTRPYYPYVTPPQPQPQPVFSSQPDLPVPPATSGAVQGAGGSLTAATSAVSGVFDSAMAWVKDNPLYAAGIGAALIFFMSSRGR